MFTEIVFPHTYLSETKTFSYFEVTLTENSDPPTIQVYTGNKSYFMHQLRNNSLERTSKVSLNI